MTRRSLLVLLLIGILLASCGGNGQATPDIAGTIDANAQTLVAALFQTQTALAPATTNTTVPTVTSLVTSTALRLSTATTFIQQPVYAIASATATGPTSTPLASSLAVGCKNLSLLGSYTDPDSPLEPGQEFTQYWKVANIGSCDWMFVFAVTHVSGEKLGDATSVRLSNKIPPGKWTTLSVNMRAPRNSGTFKASWRLTDGSTPFGAVLPVSITVGGPTKTPEPDTDATDTAAAQNAINTAVQAAVNATASKAAANAAATASKEAADAAATASKAAADAAATASKEAADAAATATCAANPADPICTPP